MPYASWRIPGAPMFERALRPAGVTLIGAGIFALCAGVGLVADAVQRRRGVRARFAWRWQ